MLPAEPASEPTQLPALGRVRQQRCVRFPRLPFLGLDWQEEEEEGSSPTPFGVISRGSPPLKGNELWEGFGGGGGQLASLTGVVAA